MGVVIYIVLTVAIFIANGTPLVPPLTVAIFALLGLVQKLVERL